MENLVVEAYHKAKSKEFFAITRVLEKILLRRYTPNHPRFAITTGQVSRILRRKGLDFVVSARADSVPVG